MNIVSLELEIVDGALKIAGTNLFGELLDRAEKEEPLVRQGSLSSGLPEDNLKFTSDSFFTTNT